ncbi:MAG: glycosyltransferase family 39 protein [Methanobacterium sp.]|nr:glycosyltransferase family 39 protein [Methanobacterium sp.]
MGNKLKYLSSINSRKLDIIITTVLCTIVVLTRLPFVSKFLYEWDSVNYALAFEKFDIIHHQPHPPGYIFFVWLGRVINIIFNDANNTMIFISIIFSILTVILIYFLVKQMFSRIIAINASILLIFNPLFWFYGEIATIYLSEAFFATLIVYLSYHVFQGNEKYFYPSILALGLSGGFRQDLVILMLPLWLFCLFYNNLNLKRIMNASIVLIFSVLIWFVPTVMLAGGYETYSYLSDILFWMCIPRTSLLFGADLFNRLSNVGAFFSWIGLIFSFFGLFISILYNRLNKRKNIIQLKKDIRTPNGVILSLWIIPAALFYLIVHLPKPGYMLSYLPAFSIILGIIFCRISIKLNKSEIFNGLSPSKILLILLSLSIIFNSVYFVYPYSYDEENVWETPFYGMNINEKIIWAMDIGFVYSTQKIKTNDRITEIYINSVKKVPDANPNNTIIVVGDISRVNEGFSWRKSMYYLPEYSIYYLIQRENYIMNPWHGKNHTNQWSKSKIFEIPVNNSTDKVVWMINDKSTYYKELKRQSEIKTIKLDNGLKIYYSDVKVKRPKNNKFIFKLDSKDI